ncbi:putative photosystem I Ycf4, assembly [Helianthus debilis subsp. tardiflorus]
MSCRSEHIWIEPIKGARKTSNFCWAIILFLGSLGFLLVGTSSYLGIVMSFYGITGLFISSYLWCTSSWNVGSGYDRFDIKDGIVCLLLVITLTYHFNPHKVINVNYFLS